MRFMVLVHPGDKKSYEAGKMPSDEFLATMGKFNEELVDAGVMLNGEGLQPSSKAVCVYFPGNGTQRVTEGPFNDIHGLVGGFWIWQVDSKEGALQWARKAPMENGATLELRQIFEPSDFSPEIEKQEKEL